MQGNYFKTIEYRVLDHIHILYIPLNVTHTLYNNVHSVNVCLSSHLVGLNTQNSLYIGYSKYYYSIFLLLLFLGRGGGVRDVVGEG